MPDYKSMYFHLLAKVSDAVDVLIDASREGEEAYISSEEPVLTVLRDEPPDTEETHV